MLVGPLLFGVGRNHGLLGLYVFLHMMVNDTRLDCHDGVSFSHSRNIFGRVGLYSTPM